MINNIQVLRAIAALMVVYFHTIGVLNSYDMSMPWTLQASYSRWGAFGVDIFFVISGFIMVYVNRNQTKNFYQFMYDRLARIVPLYWFFTFLFVGLYCTFPEAFRAKAIDTADVFGSLFFYQQLIRKDSPVLMLGWTLEYEMVFYFIFGLSLFAKALQRTVLIASSILILFVIAGMDYIVLEFILGMIIAWFYVSNSAIKLHNLMAILSVILGFGFIIIASNFYQPERIPVMIGAVLVFIGFLYFKPIKNKTILLLGNASYSLYLIQLFTIPVFFKVATAFFSVHTNFQKTTVVLMCLVFTSFSAIISYYLIEKTALKLLSRKK